MKLLVFGATGHIGQHFVQQALEAGHTVTAFARTPAKLPQQHPQLHIFQGDVLDPQAVTQAMQGQDAVACILGAGKQLTGTIRSEGTKQIIQAMEATGIRRLICQSTLGAGDSWGNLNFFWKYIMFGDLLRKVFADHQKQEALVKQSHLDWTIVRPSAFTDGERTRQYRYGFPSSDKTTKLKISRADVADFLLRQLRDDAAIHQTPGVSY
ncbi:SDR family oxidoreductase [filamentous cyanobacterium LEGE 11480]|uniref:SDR family oxidoreductase n=1 Tax=Romeriopsis navalis LEGE 11480 TaxID=2777977 RepID=A0A928Z4M3_9CYAN|nr:SDR family oxidoreductase [Romeriopsis navalis]MBE9030365.1 SDR family oxidoreductase [Romeriopsis navalis LEGE 11480]